MRHKNEGGSNILGNVAGVITADPSQASVIHAVMTGNCTLLIKQADPGTSMRLIVVQDGTGARTLTLNGSNEAAPIFGGATTISPNATANQATVYDIVWHRTTDCSITKQ